VDDVLYAFDPNFNVRHNGLSGALNIGLALPAGILASLAQYDASHFVRALALRAMSEASGADEWEVRSMVQAAFADSYPDVRAQAQTVLSMLNQAHQPSKRAWQ
jgi:hypothetical protein